MSQDPLPSRYLQLRRHWQHTCSRPEMFFYRPREFILDILNVKHTARQMLSIIVSSGSNDYTHLNEVGSAIDLRG
jgi:hypothetical protein